MMLWPGGRKRSGSSSKFAIVGGGGDIQDGVSEGVRGCDSDETGRNCAAGVAVSPRVSAVPEISATGEVVGLLQFQVRQLLRIKEAHLDRVWPTSLSAYPGEAVQLATRCPRELQIEQEKISSTMPLISSSKARWLPVRREYPS